MIRIISDTSTMYSTEAALKAGFSVSPLQVTIDGQGYRELDEITAAEFVMQIEKGHMPSSSQPAIGEVMELYEKHAGDEILNLAMADGLSGTYSSAIAAAGSLGEEQKITVVNTRTLCGSHRCIVETAVRLAQENRSCEEILRCVEEMMDTAKSFLMPADFDYLRRGGRLSPLVSFVGKTIRLSPVLTQSDDGKQLVMHGIKRSFKQAIVHVSNALVAHGIGKGWKIYITHAEVPAKAEEAAEILREFFPEAEYEVFPLTPAFITQGGPGCVAVQAVKLI